jgi:hypothetical protein
MSSSTATTTRLTRPKTTGNTIRRSQTTKSARPSQTNDKPDEQQQAELAEREALVQYLIEMRKQKTGLTQYPIYKQPPQEFSDSYNINHPEFKPNQRMIMNNLCHIYSVHPLKVYKKYQYLSLLDKQRQISQFTNTLTFLITYYSLILLAYFASNSNNCFILLFFFTNKTKRNI